MLSSLEVLMNGLRTALLFVVLTLLFLFVGFLIGGRGGLTIAFVVAMVMNLGSYWFSDKIVLAMYRAKPIQESDNPRLYNIVKSVSQMAKLPMPRVYIIPNPSPNAFATGRNPEHAALAATEGILQILDDDELTAVISHELGHVRNRDTLVGAIAATLAGAISYLAFMARWMPFFGGGDDDDRGGNLIVMLLIGILSPIAAALIQMAISRQREYGADKESAMISHKPLALASALRKLDSMTKRIPLQSNPATAHLFIVNPFNMKNFSALFSTHPPIEDRIARLEEYARSGF
jgi:heat shock protein HtpX